MKAMDKAPTGVEGFDEMTGGGLPRGRTTLLFGRPGTGKTVFVLQTVVHGARNLEEPGIFVAFEESASNIRVNAANMGWDLTSLENEKLFFLDARIPIETIQTGEFELSGLLSTLEAKAQEMGARRIVFDAIDVLLTLLDDPVAERRELYRLHEWIQNHNYTGIITAKTGAGDGQITSPYGFLEYMSDCVVSLEHSSRQLTSERYLTIVKYRGSGFVENRSPLLIGARGIQVAGPNPMGLGHPVFEERLSSGVAPLDDMLDGGYYRGTNMLITGAPGTAKTTLSGAFLDAACRRGERATFISFDEAADEIVRNLRSVNIDLQPHRDAGLLQMHSAYSGFQSAEGHLMTLQTMIDEHGPTCLVVDPLSALLKSGEEYSALDVAQRLLYGAKSQGITTLCTSLMGTHVALTPGTALSVSTIADTWIHVSYQSQGGEQNRTLHIVKSRGTGHSNQVRELSLSDEGITLSHVYTAGGDVLLGTLRWEKEEEQRREQERVRRHVQEKRRELQLAEAEVEVRIRLLERELEGHSAELAELEVEQERLLQRRQATRNVVRQMRLGSQENSGDAPGSRDGRDEEE